MFAKKTVFHLIFLLVVLTVRSEGFSGHHYEKLYEGDSCVDVASEQKGICTPLSYCPEVNNNFDYFQKNGTKCWAGKGTSVVCCVKPVSQYVPPDKRTISQKKCLEYTKDISTDKLDTPPERVKRQSEPKDPEVHEDGASETSPEILPPQIAHMAALGWPTAGEDPVFKCSGTIISELFILTSAHCTTTEDPDVTSPKPTTVRVGDYNLPSNAAPDVKHIFIPIEKLIRHPEYKAPLKYHDIALVELKSPLNFNAFVRPACLWPVADNGDKEFGISMRWTVDENADSAESKVKLLQTPVHLFGNILCKAVSTVEVRDENWPQGISSEQLCAGDFLHGEEICKGETGGPIVVNGPSDISIYYVIGVNSFVDVCKNGKGVTFYERVNAYTPWIESIVWPAQ